MQAIVSYTIAYLALLALLPNHFLRDDGYGPRQFGWEEYETPAPLWLAALTATVLLFKGHHLLRYRPF